LELQVFPLSIDVPGGTLMLKGDACKPKDVADFY